MNRDDFPALAQEIDGRRLVYLDSAATALKPRAVIDAVRHHYERDTANIHRAVHTLARRATEAYEAARARVAAFLGAASPAELVFVRNATEAINLVAQAWARPALRPGDEILITELEHHSNIVPWQLVCEQTGARLVVARIEDDGDVAAARVTAAITGRTRVVALAHVSNVLGTVLPVAAIARAAHDAGAVVVVDGAQAAPHLRVDVAALGCDFYAVSGHKLYGPTGIGALWGREALLDAMPPYQGGGEMIKAVTFERTEYNDVPYKFEAGTPNIAGAIGLGAAVDYVAAVGLAAIAAHERRVGGYARDALRAVPGLRLLGDAPDKLGVFAFTLDGAHPHDVGTIVDTEGVAIRTGHHCAQPLLDRFGVPATARASLGMYNDTDDIDALVAALHRVREVMT